MAVPKQRKSRRRRDQRRSHLAAPRPHLMECPQCHSPKRPHRVCGECGHYAGREAIEIPDRFAEGLGSTDA
ncbi:MAG: 50S ribosomal protein L32 [Solirubrobacterales bacterium]